MRERDRTSTRRNIETLQALADAFNRRDDSVVASLMHPEVAFHSACFENKTYLGSAGVAQYRADVDGAWSRWRLEDYRFLDAGNDRVLQLYRLSGIGRGSGAPVQQEAAILWRLRAGKVVAGRAFLNRSEALKAAGLEQGSVSSPGASLRFHGTTAREHCQPLGIESQRNCRCDRQHPAA